MKYDVQKGRDFSRGGVEEDKQLLGELLDNEQEGGMCMVLHIRANSYSMLHRRVGFRSDELETSRRKDGCGTCLARPRKTAQVRTMSVLLCMFYNFGCTFLGLKFPR